MEVSVFNKKRFDQELILGHVREDNVEKFIDHCFISINDTTETDEIPYFKEPHKNALTLFFDDIDKDTEVLLIGTDKTTLVKAMTPEQAQQIVSFIQKNETKRYCFVHCAGGVSRSGAVGTFIVDLLREDDRVFKNRHPHIHPNSHVLSLLRQASGLTPTPVQ